MQPGQASRLEAVAISKPSCLFSSQKEMTMTATIVGSSASSGEAWRGPPHDGGIQALFPCFPAAPGRPGAWEDTGAEEPGRLGFKY